MTTNNQNFPNSNDNTEVNNFSKAAVVGRIPTSKTLEKTLTNLKTLSLRPTKSIKRNSSVRPVKKVK
jgi:hypothetical protein